jgi:succinate dehydrogenase/fumarate reductase flavoprotein subunit
MIATDVLIIGSEGVGARAAIAAADKGMDVLIATKGRMGKSGATVTAIAGFAVGGQGIREVLGLPGNAEDRPELFFEDIVNEGKFINNQKLVGLIVQEGPRRVRELIDWGMKVVVSEARIPGHRYPRCVTTSGRQVVSALRRKVRQYARIRIIEDLMITDLLLVDGRVAAAVGLDLGKGELVTISAKAVILASGGAQMIYPIQTAPEELTGDGQAMACRAGAELIDMEMVQFHPCNLISPPAWNGLGFPFTIGPGGGLRSTWLLNKWGERFMQNWDPQRMENATRDVLAVAIMTEVLEGRGSPHGGVYLSLAHLPPNLIDYFGQWFHLVRPNWRYGGFKFGPLIEEIKQGYAMEVGPACHFFMGGIKINENCETNVGGLFAAGEVAGGGHGANRLSDVALTEIFVHGAIAGKQAAQYAGKTKALPIDASVVKGLEERLLQPLLRAQGTSPFEIKKKVQSLAWKNAGVIRTEDSLVAALREIQALREQELPRLCCRAKDREYNREWMDAIQLENIVTVLECIARAALARKESRGAHFRKDYPQSDNLNYLKNVVLSARQGELTLSWVPVEAARCPVAQEGEKL